MPRPLKFVACALALGVFVATTAHADDAPLTGDSYAGGRLYAVDCAACHGASGDGNGPMAQTLNPRPTRLRDGSFLFSLPEAEMVKAILGANDPAGVVAHRQGLSELDAHDILAWLRGPVPTLGELVPTAARYVSATEKLDKDALARAAKEAGQPLPEAEHTITEYVLFLLKPVGTETPPVNGHPTRIPNNPGKLYAEAKPNRKVAFVAYEPLKLDKGTIEAALVVDWQMMLTQVRAVPSSDPKVEALGRKLQPILSAYVGSGGEMNRKPVRPQKRWVRAPKDVQTAMLLAYARLREGAAMYKIGEQNRFWDDQESFKFPAAVDQGKVKFQFKEHGTKKHHRRRR